MIPDATTLNAWAADWSGQMVAILWQSALLAGAVGLVASLLWRTSPAVRYWMWQIVAAKLLLMPLWTVSLALAWLPATAEMSRPAQQAAALTEIAAQELPDIVPSSPTPLPIASDMPWPDDGKAPELLEPPLSWAAWLMLAWAMVVFGQCALLLWHLARLRNLLRHASPGSDALQSLVRDCAARVKLVRTPRVLTVDKERSPFVCGVWRPVIVLPKSLEKLLADGLLDPVILHELAHVKRLDLLWNWIPQIARTLYFFNPIVHWVAFRIRLEGELACDGWAMVTTGKAAGDYADLLVRVVSQLSEPAMFGTGSAASAGLDGQGNVSGNK